MASATLGMSKSYNSNSVLQNSASHFLLELIDEAIAALDVASVDIIADFGSSHGANSIHAMKTIIDYLRRENKLFKEPLVIHNDLPSNDWTALFRLLDQNNSYKGVVSGRSFYEQCLPESSVAISYSSTSLHWLSKKPANALNNYHVYFADNPDAYRAFQHQAALDYSQFLKHRSSELVSGGVLILSIPCVDSQGIIGIERILELLYTCAQLLPLTSAELHDYTNPVYCRSYEECVDENLFSQNGLQLIKFTTVSIESPLYRQWRKKEITFDEYTQSTTLFTQGFSESILEQTLQKHDRAVEDIPYLLKQFWNLFEQHLRKQPEIGDYIAPFICLILKKK
ncbi:unnamed protein product [Adineta ricciae]|uniref:SAM dependent carboxyl methyltransferase n=1 Tax=Adineta ricciae TaxID=249248 RepID=A0A815Y2L6_ADIRI|nr:unnamed protein product [Adineta ricciae]CAF1564967.1 unnamed protein product [Adineta ricciae]